MLPFLKICCDQNCASLQIKTGKIWTWSLMNAKVQTNKFYFWLLNLSKNTWGMNELWNWKKNLLVIYPLIPTQHYTIDQNSDHWQRNIHKHEAMSGFGRMRENTGHEGKLQWSPNWRIWGITSEDFECCKLVFSHPPRLISRFFHAVYISWEGELVKWKGGKVKGNPSK